MCVCVCIFITVTGGGKWVGDGNSLTLLLNQPRVNPEQYFNTADEYKCFLRSAPINFSTLRLSSIFLGYPKHKQPVLLEAQIHQIEKEAFSFLPVGTPSPRP